MAGAPAIEEVHPFHHGILLLLAPLLVQLCAHVIGYRLVSPIISRIVSRRTLTAVSPRRLSSSVHR
jgi:hypothetical protein